MCYIWSSLALPLDYGLNQALYPINYGIGVTTNGMNNGIPSVFSQANIPDPMNIGMNGKMPLNVPTNGTRQQEQLKPQYPFMKNICSLISEVTRPVTQVIKAIFSPLIPGKGQQQQILPNNGIPTQQQQQQQGMILQPGLSQQPTMVQQQQGMQVGLYPNLATMQV